MAIYDYWEYFEPIRQFAPPDVVKYTQLMVDVVDKILLKSNNTTKAQELKDAFGLGEITDNRDFANVLTNGIYGWQSTKYVFNGIEVFYKANTQVAGTQKSILRVSSSMLLV